MREPGSAEDFEVRELAHDEVAKWYHVYSTRSHPDTRADTFAEGRGDTRFAPILREDGTPVHTYYVASSPEAAYIASVLHDAALSPPGLFEVAALAHFHLVRLRLPAALRYVSFHTPYLPRLQIERAQLIDSLPAMTRPDSGPRRPICSGRWRRRSAMAPSATTRRAA